MHRPSLLGLSTTVAALAVATVAAAAAPASAATLTCRTTLSGGLVGNEVIASSTDVFAEAAAAPQRVVIDKVTVNWFGQKRYRLAAPIKLVNTKGAVATTFRGGTGYYVSEQDLRQTQDFAACSTRISA
jgi:hypothetical protein